MALSIKRQRRIKKHTPQKKKVAKVGLERQRVERPGFQWFCYGTVRRQEEQEV